MSMTRIGAVISLVALAWFAAGCVMADHCSVYEIRGRVVQAGTDRPLSGAAISITPTWADERPPDLPAQTITDTDGKFVAQWYTGITWGITYLFGFIPLRSGDPVPPPVEGVDVRIDTPRAGVFLQLHPTPEQQSATLEAGRIIELGTLEFRPERTRASAPAYGRTIQPLPKELNK